MKYLASQIIERAERLADISNTDFLTYKEKGQYLQDAWTSVYQQLINKGDKQFVKEVELMNSGSPVGEWTEYELPDDLFQICSVKNKISGSIVPRYSESESINSGTYEVVNNKLRLYGALNAPLLLTYWIIPTYISFPDKDVGVDVNGNILSSAGNSILTDTGSIVNIKNGETLGSITIKQDCEYQLGNGHVVEVGELESDTDTWTIDDKLVNAHLTEIATPLGTADEPVTISEDVYKYNDDYYYRPDNETTVQKVVNINDSGEYFTTTDDGSNAFYVTNSHPAETDGYIARKQLMKWTTSTTNNKFLVANPDMTFGYFSAVVDGETTYFMMTDIDNSDFPDEPQFSTVAVHGGNDNPIDYYESLPSWRTDVTDTITGSFVLLYDDDTMALTLMYKNGSTYYRMRDYAQGTVSSNLVQYTGTVSGEIAISSYNIYNIAGPTQVYGTTDTNRYRVVFAGARFYSTSGGWIVDTPVVVSSQSYRTCIEYNYLFGSSKYAISGFVPWYYETQEYYPAMYKITGLTSTELETEEVTSEDVKHELSLLTDELTVTYSVYRYYYYGLNYLDYDGNKVYETTTAGTYTTFLDSDYNVNYQVLEEGLYSNPKLMSYELFEMPESEIIPKFVSAHEGLFLFATQIDGDNYLTGYVPEEESYIEEYKLEYTPREILPVERFNNDRAFLVKTTGNKYRLWTFNDDYELTDERVDIKAPIGLALCKYGPLVSNGTDATLKSGIPDTLLDFPNDFYFSIIAIDLAMRYAMKQNVDCTGLQAQYDTMWFTFMNALEQDSAYNRIVNIYN